MLAVCIELDLATLCTTCCGSVSRGCTTLRVQEGDDDRRAGEVCEGNMFVTRVTRGVRGPSPWGVRVYGDLECVCVVCVCVCGRPDVQGLCLRSSTTECRVRWRVVVGGVCESWLAGDVCVCVCVVGSMCAVLIDDVSAVRPEVYASWLVGDVCVCVCVVGSVV